MRRIIHPLKPPTVTHIERVGRKEAIKGYNRLLTLPQSALLDSQIRDLKKELVDKEIITEDHEGPIDVS